MVMYVPIEFRFSKDHKIFNSSISKHLNISPSENSDRPIYYCEKRVTYKSIEYKAVVLSLFYTVNPGYCCKIGYHPVDIEHLVILIDPVTDKPEHVYFSAHGKGEGTWLPFEDCIKNANGLLVVYVSPSSNAMYPFPGTYWRLGGVANDVCSNNGKSWFPRIEDFENAESQRWSDSHYQIAKGINSPKNISPPVERSINATQRFFMFLPNVRKEVRSQPRLEWVGWF